MSGAMPPGVRENEIGVDPPGFPDDCCCVCGTPAKTYDHECRGCDLPVCRECDQGEGDFNGVSWTWDANCARKECEESR